MFKKIQKPLYKIKFIHLLFALISELVWGIVNTRERERERAKKSIKSKHVLTFFTSIYLLKMKIK